MPGQNLRTALLVALVATTALTSCQQVTERGEVRNPSARIERDGAASAIVGGKVFWAFGDTFTPTGGVHSSGAYAERATPTSVTEPLVNGTPHQLVPFSDEERRDHQMATDGSRWVIWPSAVIPTSNDRALVFSTKFHATPRGWIDAALVVSELRAGSTRTTRLAEPLRAPQANYATGIYARGGFVYLHDCGGANVPPELASRLGSTLPALDPVPSPVLGANLTPGRCRLARVPLSQATDGAAYRYWTALGWSPDATAALAVVPGTNSGLSVAWSESRGAYVSLVNPSFSPEIELRTAPRPEGPWSRPTTVLTAETDAYAVRIHPHLSTPDLATAGVSYFRQDQPHRRGAVVLVDLVIPTS